MLDYSLSLYDYNLPDELIAQYSLRPHHNSRLMVVDRSSGEILDETTCWNLDTLIPKNRVLFFNNSKVLRARLALENFQIVTEMEEKKGVNEGEIFFLSLITADTFEALVRPGKIFKKGVKIYAHGRTFEVLENSSSGRILRLLDGSILDFFDRYGSLPLPPYIGYSEEKAKDYQSIFASKLGSVAAPTASLHFTPELIEKIQNEKKTITLHIGLGTFQGVKTEDIRDFEIHEEMIEVPLGIFDTIASIDKRGEKILAVGTTVSRSLESLPYLWKILSEDLRSKYSKETQEFWNSKTTLPNQFVKEYTLDNGVLLFFTKIYIFEGYSFQIVEDMITNFHLPRSSLLILISSLLGRTRTMELYHYAIRKKYRFFSFGDAMYIRGK